MSPPILDLEALGRSTAPPVTPVSHGASLQRCPVALPHAPHKVWVSSQAQRKAAGSTKSPRDTRALSTKVDRVRT